MLIMVITITDTMGHITIAPIMVRVTMMDIMVRIIIAVITAVIPEVHVIITVPAIIMR
jgi:hypothetical protein